MSSEQQKILSLYLRAYISKLQYEVNQQNMQTGDTLLRLAGKKLEHGIITKYEYNQIELQQLKTAQNVVTQERSYHDLLISLAMELGTQSADKHGLQCGIVIGTPEQSPVSFRGNAT